MIDTIVFDLGGVLIDWNPRYVYKHRFVTNDAMEYFLENICTNEWNELQDAGRSFEEATDILVKRFPEYSKEIAAYYGCWEDMLKGTINETVQLLRELKVSRKYKLYALTNWSAESFPIALAKYEFLSWFDGILVSGEENMKKPDPAIFSLLVNRYEIDTRHCLFIDDNSKNIHTAELLGFNCVHFDHVMDKIQQIRKLLKEHM